MLTLIIAIFVFTNWGGENGFRAIDKAVGIMPRYGEQCTFGIACFFCLVTDNSRVFDLAQEVCVVEGLHAN